jgi:hypothetical protein
LKGEKMNNCQCENKIHFEGKAHKYGEKFNILIPVKTDYGIFEVCENCTECLKDYEIIKGQ